MKRRQSKRAERRAGGNWHGRSKYGQHTLQEWKSGSNWVECQRCGFDVYEEDSSRQWDGLIVCDGCKDPRHPQDFVRGRKDTTAPTGLSTGSTAYDATEVSGSTSNPSGTFGDYLGAEISPEKAPDELTSVTLSGWWDYSFAGVASQAGQGGAWQEEGDPPNTPASDGNKLEQVDDRSGNGFRAFQNGTTVTWDENARDGLGAYNGAGAFGAHDGRSHGNLFEASEMTLMVIYRMQGSDSISAAYAGKIFSATADGSRSSSWYCDNGETGAGGNLRIRQLAGSVLVTTDITIQNNSDEWVAILYQLSDSRKCKAYWTRGSTGAIDIQEDDGNGIIDTTGGSSGAFVIGAGPTLGDDYGGQIGEIALFQGWPSQVDRESLFLYISNKWSIG